ncbi:outer membrane lipoprotein carrier protein LolA [Sphaerimonospora cavernae]|uniref:Outer membrane lipoprotein carrier protein LolA n=1 Tax=Sphaerimonospora cavernae TaxID=1740611 RepID=A0ABV6UBN9_9ACTN
MSISKRARAVRWGVPIAVTAVVAAAVGAGPVIAAVRGEPSLPERTAERLLADAAQAWQQNWVRPMSGTIVETASLGLPALPALTGGGTGALSLLSGSHRLKVWYGDPGEIRVMLPGEMSETDLISNRDETWLWDSAANKATRLSAPGVAPAGVAPIGEQAERMPLEPMTPRHAAQEAIKAAGADTEISVGADARVAGRAAYELVLTPKTSASLVKDVRLALDGETLIPLRVQVYAKGSAEPAFEMGFESVTFSRPAPENFTFTPPPGAKVEQTALPYRSDGGAKAGPPNDVRANDLTAKAGEGRIVGTGWDSVLVTSLPDTLKADTGGSDTGGSDTGGSDAGGSDAAKTLDGVLKSATRVSGAWGSGRLVRTKLVSALITDDGRLVAGAVTPEALYRAAAS